MTATARFAVEPREALSGDEQQLLARLAVLDSSHVLGSSEPFRVQIVSAPAWPAPDPDDLPDFAPARLRSSAGGSGFCTGVTSRSWTRRPARAGSTVRTGLRASASCCGSRRAAACRSSAVCRSTLPGWVLDGSGLYLFGPSGAGKSTLAASFEGTPLSDELVALAGAPFRLWGTGFWGTFESEKRSVDSAPSRRWSPWTRAPASPWSASTLPSPGGFSGPILIPLERAYGQQRLASSGGWSARSPSTG